MKRKGSDKRSHFGRNGIYYKCGAAAGGAHEEHAAAAYVPGRMLTATRIQLVLQIDQGNLGGMRELASTDAVYIK